jgi:tripeptide aminopeptidase
MINAFYAAADEFKTDGMNPRIEILVDDDFPQTLIPEDHMVIRLARKAALNLGVTLTGRTIGGGADANVFFGKGIMAGVLGTGMTDVHTLNESIHIRDMENSAKLVMEILKVHAAGDLS